MAGRFIFQKFASGMSRSTSRLSAYASASARATAPVITRPSEAGIRTLSDVIHGVARDTTPVMPGASEAGFRTLSNVIHGAAAHPGMSVPGRHGLHGCGARYLNTFPCSREAAKTGMPGPVGGVKPYSSGASNKLQRTDWLARVKAWWAPNELNTLDQMDTPFRNLFLMIALAAACLVPLPTDGKSSKKIPVNHCSGCCNCLRGPSNS